MTSKQMEIPGAFITLSLLILTMNSSSIKGLLVEETAHFKPSCLAASKTQRLVVNNRNNTNETVPFFTPSEFKVSRGHHLDIEEDTPNIVEIKVNFQRRTIVSYCFGVNTVVSNTFYESVHVTIGPSCLHGNSVSEGYMKAWTSANGKCLRTPSAAVLGRARWYQHNQQMSANETDSSFPVLTVLCPKDINRNYLCKGSTVSSYPNGITFNPEWTFRPQHIFSDINQTTTDLYSKESETIRIYVSVPKCGVNSDIKLEKAIRRTIYTFAAYYLSLRITDSFFLLNAIVSNYLDITSGGQNDLTANVKASKNISGTVIGHFRVENLTTVIREIVVLGQVLVFTLDILIFSLAPRYDIHGYGFVLGNDMPENLTKSRYSYEPGRRNEGPHIFPIIGTVLDGVIVIILVIFGYVIYRKRCQKPSIQSQGENGENQPAEHTPRGQEQLERTEIHVQHTYVNLRDALERQEVAEQQDNHSIGQLYDSSSNQFYHKIQIWLDGQQRENSSEGSACLIPTNPSSSTSVIENGNTERLLSLNQVIDSDQDSEIAESIIPINPSSFNSTKEDFEDTL